MEDKDFSLFLPAETHVLEKSLNGKEHGNYVRGWASTPDQDSEGDIVLPSSLDISYFLSQGSINYEHQMGSQYHIGTPTTNTYIDPAKGLFVEAKLDMTNPYARRMWETARRAEQQGKHLGFSIEGRFSGRDATNPNIITSVNVKEVALTTNPANRKATWERLTKSLTAGTETNPAEMTNGEALRKESLATKINSLTNDLNTASPEALLQTAKDLDVSPNVLTEGGLFVVQKANEVNTSHVLAEPSTKQLKEEEQPPVPPKPSEKEEPHMAEKDSQELANARAELDKLKAKQAEMEKQQAQLLADREANTKKEAELQQQKKEQELIEKARQEALEEARKEYEEKAKKEAGKAEVETATAHTIEPSPEMKLIMEQLKAQNEAMKALQEQMVNKSANTQPAVASSTPADSKAVVTSPPDGASAVTPPTLNPNQTDVEATPAQPKEKTVQEMSMEEIEKEREESLKRYDIWFRNNLSKLSTDQAKAYRQATSGLWHGNSTEANYNVVKEIWDEVRAED